MSALCQLGADGIQVAQGVSSEYVYVPMRLAKMLGKLSKELDNLDKLSGYVSGTFSNGITPLRDNLNVFGVEMSNSFPSKATQIENIFQRLQEAVELHQRLEAVDSD